MAEVVILRQWPMLGVLEISTLLSVERYSLSFDAAGDSGLSKEGDDDRRLQTRRN